jgi:phospholipid/cholesterol/gamma-HCH transport system substrate-binding protein
MPDRRKVRWSQLKVGVIGLAAFLILFVLVFLLTSSKGIPFIQKNALLRTYMDDASGISDGTVVRLNGIAIGYLEKPRLTGSRDPKSSVEFDMMVRKEFLREIPVDSVAGIAAANLLGDKFINITKGTSSQTVTDGATLRALETQDIPELLGQMDKLLRTFQTIVNRVDGLLADVESGKGNLGLFLKDDALYSRLNGIVSEGQKLLTDVRTGNGTVSKLLNDDALYQEMRAPLKRLDEILADLQGGQGSAGKLLKDPTLYNELNQTVASVHELVAYVNSGRGNAGKLLKDEQLHQRMTELIAKLNTTLDKVNAGQGTLGQFMVNPQLYDSLTGLTHEFQSLAKDMRANPKKFLSIRLVLF